MKTLFYFPLLLLTALLSGCVDNDENSGKAPKGNGRVLTVNYAFDAPTTRSVVATGGERTVRDVAMLFYKADDESYVGWQTVNVPAGNSSGSFLLPLPDAIHEGERYKLIVIGNYSEYAPAGKSIEEYAAANIDVTYTDMRKNIIGALKTGQRMVSPLPFYGRLMDTDGEETTLTGPAEDDPRLDVSVRFSRTVARFDLINRAAGKLKIEWVKVGNYRSQGYYYHENFAGIAGGDVVRGTSSEPPASNQPGYVFADAPVADRQVLNTGGLYAFPNAVAFTAQGDNRTTFLLVAGRYKGPSDADYSDELTYYRVNASINGANQMLQRNYIYTIVINNVKGPGAGSEDEAANEDEKLIDYIIDDEWEDDNGGTVVDPEGNYLILSRSTIVLPGMAGSSELVKVSVKEGTDWVLEWDNPTSDFKFERINDTSFTITAVNDNADDFTKNARLTVKVTGVTSDLKMPVSVIQLSNKNDPALLMVDGQMGEISYTIPGQGAVLTLPVVTGSASGIWTASADNDLHQFTGLYFSPKGANNGVLTVDFPANINDATRTGVLTVSRAGAPDVTITFVQDVTPYMINILPQNIQTEGIVVDGFDARTTAIGGIQNGISKNISFQVTLPNTMTFTATFDGNSQSDAFVTLNNKDVTKTSANFLNSNGNYPNTTAKAPSGSTIWLNVFRTGPGDKEINKTITITAYSGNAVKGTIAIPVKITSSCQIGDVKLALLWADRNVGAIPRGPNATVGLNYINYDRAVEDFINTEFRGIAHTQPEAVAMCANFGAANNYEEIAMKTKWRLPSSAEVKAIVPSLIISKNRVFLTNAIRGCWFPLSDASTVGFYWTGTLTSIPAGGCFYSSIYNNASSHGEASAHSTANRHFVRCVHDY